MTHSLAIPDGLDLDATIENEHTATFSPVWDDAGIDLSRRALDRLANDDVHTALLLATEAARRAQSTRSEAEALRVLGAALAASGRSAEARSCFERAITAARRTDDDACAIRAQLGLARTYLNDGATELADIHLRRAAASAEDCGDHVAIAVGHGLSARLAELRGDLARAIELIGRDLAASAAAGAHELRRVALLELSRVLRLAGRIADAREAASECAELCLSGGDHVNGARARIELALARAAGADPSVVSVELDRITAHAMPRNAQARRHRALAEAELSAMCGRADDAEIAFAAARDTMAGDPGTISARVVQAHLLFGRALADGGHRQRAIAYLRDGYALAKVGRHVELARELLDALARLDDRDVLADGLVTDDPAESGGRAHPTRASLESIIGDAPAMAKLRNLAAKAAATDVTALILGESGTGKELLATAIHGESRRAAKPPIVVNCAAFPESLIESELFGHVKGAFSHATADRAGAFERAHGSTLFLDEVGELSLAVQAKLLRVLEQGQVQKVGADKPIFVDVRVIAATNRDLSAMVAAREFRADLYHRLDKLTLRTVPLRAHVQDLPAIVAHLLRVRPVFAERGIRSVSRAALDVLSIYSFPGNVRELDNALIAAAFECEDGTIQSSHLPDKIVHHEPPTDRAERIDRRASIGPMLAAGFCLDDHERALIERALNQAGGNKTAAAKLLGITRRRLYSRLKHFGM